MICLTLDLRLYCAKCHVQNVNFDLTQSTISFQPFPQPPSKISIASNVLRAYFPMKHNILATQPTTIHHLA